MASISIFVQEATTWTKHRLLSLLVGNIQYRDNMNYTKWIEENVTDPRDKCFETTLDMQEAFPELTRVRGYYHGAPGPRPHWWLVAPDGKIVDPTASQFPSRGEYEPFEGPEPTGMCPNCGGYIYDNNSVCSYKCGDEYSKYLVDGVL